jgi:hypothetical protein
MTGPSDLSGTCTVRQIPIPASTFSAESANATFEPTAYTVGIMVCATCDFRSPCACERKRVAESGGTASPVPTRNAEVDRLRQRLKAAANVIAALLLEQGHPSPVLAEEAEELLRRLREE